MAAAVAGLAGAIAMAPAGALLIASGQQVNRYGELLARHIFGTTLPAVLLAEHLVIGVLSAAPLAVLLLSRRPAWPAAVALGLGYGVGYWLAVNTLALPWYFAQPNPWGQGPGALLPSLFVHLVYGVATALALRWWYGRASAAGA